MHCLRNFVVILRQSSGEPWTNSLTIHLTQTSCSLGIFWTLRECSHLFSLAGAFSTAPWRFWMPVPSAKRLLSPLLESGFNRIFSFLDVSNSGSRLNPLGQTMAHISFQSIIFKSFKRGLLIFVEMRHIGG